MEECYGSKSKGSLFVKGLSASKTSDKDKIEMENVPYRTLTGALQFLACHSRPDISFEVATLSKFNSGPCMEHWEALKQLLRYLRYTHSLGLVLGGKAPLTLTAYADSGFKSDPDTGRSPGGFVFFLGGSMVAHKSSWFKSIFPSSTETEIAALYMATSMAIWMTKICKSFGMHMESVQIFEDNDGAIKWSHSQERAGRMKHIDQKFLWIREKLKDGCISISYVKSEDNTADLFTKTLCGAALLKHRAGLGLKEMDDL
jgi:hypothetical protein